MILNNLKNLLNFNLLYITGGFIGSVLAGIFLYGIDVFTVYSPGFQFLIYGFAGSIYFYTFEIFERKIQLWIFMAVYLLIVFLFIHPLLPIYMIREFIFLLAIFIGIKSYYSFIDSYTYLPVFFRAIACVFILIISSTIAVVFLFIIYNLVFLKEVSNILYSIIMQGKIFMYMGLGLGVGFDIAHLIKEKVEK